MKKPIILSIIAGLSSVTVPCLSAMPRFTEKRLKLVTQLGADTARIYGRRERRLKAISDVFAKLRKATRKEPGKESPPPLAVAGDELSVAPLSDSRACGPQSPEPGAYVVNGDLELKPVEYGVKKVKASEPVDVASATGVHVVAPGDTLCSIAGKYYGSPRLWRELARCNGIGDPSALRPGMRLRVPPDLASRRSTRVSRPITTASAAPRLVDRATAPSEPSLDYRNYEWKAYQVKPGDTLSSISMRFYGNTEKVDELKKHNRLAPDGGLEVGRCLYIPFPKSSKISERYLLSTKGIFR